jgi:flagellar operon protein
MDINYKNLTVQGKIVNNTGVNELKFKNTEINSSFNDVFKNTINEHKPLQFSKHANMRLNTRNISLSQEQLTRVQKGVNDASVKGIKDSLVLVDDIALVVNIKTKTVITAMNEQSKNIFTNIDGAVIV